MSILTVVPSTSGSIAWPGHVSSTPCLRQPDGSLLINGFTYAPDQTTPAPVPHGYVAISGVLHPLVMAATTQPVTLKTAAQKLFSLAINGQTYPGIPLENLSYSSDTEEPSAPAPVQPCAFCTKLAITTLFECTPRLAWNVCQQSRCVAAAEAQKDRVYAGLVDCEETRRSALEWADRRVK